MTSILRMGHSSLCGALLCGPLLIVCLAMGGLGPACAQERWPAGMIAVSDAALATEGIETAQARTGALPGHIDAPAYVALDERRTTRIRPVGLGRVVAVLVSPGETVRRGQTLFTYDDFSLSDETQQLASAQAALQQAQAMERDAVLADQRGRELTGGAVSAGEAARRHARLQDARGLVAQRTAMVRNERERMARFFSTTEQARGIRSSVVSPIDGIVRHVSIAAGEEVTGGTLVPVEVDDLTKVWVISQVDEADVGDLATGNRQLTWIRPDRPPIESRIDIIEGSVDPATRHVLVRSLLSNTDQRLRPDMLVRTRLFEGQPVPGVLVPSAAVQTIADAPCVFVRVAPERYQARHVAIGPALDGQTIVTSGVSAGETVVTRGSFMLKSQAMLNPEPDTPASASHDTARAG